MKKLILLTGLLLSIGLKAPVMNGTVRQQSISMINQAYNILRTTGNEQQVLALYGNAIAADPTYSVSYMKRARTC